MGYDRDTTNCSKEDHLVDLRATGSFREKLLRIFGILIAVAVVLIAANLACAVNSKTVRIATEGAYPPYNDMNEAGEIIGFEREMGDELCRRAGLECVWELHDWDSIMVNLVDEQFDVIIAGMTITEERDKIIDFTQPYVPPSPSVYVAQDNGSAAALGDRLMDPAQRTGVHVGAQRATIHSDYLAEEGVRHWTYDLVPDAIDALLNGEVEVVFADSRFVRESMAEHETRMTTVGSQVLIGTGVGAGTREADEDLREKLNQAITSMKDDGSLNELIQDWFGEDAPIF